MKKLFSLLSLLFFVLLHAEGQTYYQVTNFNGTSNYGGTNVTVTSGGSVSTGGGQCFITPTPYWAGPGGNGQYTFTFSQPVGTVEVYAEGLNPGEYVQIFINGVAYCITPCNIVCSYAIQCVNGGNLGFNQNCLYYGPNTLYGGGEMIFPYGNITSFEVFCNGTLAGTDFWVKFSPTVNYNQCPSCFNASNNGPICAGDSLKLNVYDPNGVSYHWTGPGGFNTTVQNPFIYPATPANAGTYTVVVTTQGGNDTAYTTAVVNPLPVISGFTITNPTTCGGSDGTISLNGLTANTAYTVNYTHNGTVVTANISANGTGAIVLTGLPAGTYSNMNVQVVSTGCNSNIVGPAVLTDPPRPPAPTLTSNSPVCLHQVLSLTATSQGADAYYWTGPAFFTSTLQNPAIPNVQNNNGGTYSAVATNTVTHCVSDTSRITININQPAVAAFSASIHLGCRMDTVFFTDNSTNAAVYNWVFGDGATDNVPNPVHEYSTLGSDVVTLYVTSSGGCIDSASQTVTFNNIVKADFTPDRDTICPGQTVNFTNASQGIGLSYVWDFGEQPGSVAINPSHTFDIAGAYDVRLVTTNFLTCQDTLVKTVYVPGISTRIGFRDTTVCLVDSMLLRNKVNVVLPQCFSGYSYQWSPADGLGSDAVQEPDFFTYGDFKYTVTVTGLPFGCAATDSATLHSEPPLHLTNVTASQTIKYGDTIQLNANGGLYYFWTPDNGTLSNPNINYPVGKPLETTDYVVHGMNQYGCTDSQVVHIDIDYTMQEFIPTAFSPNGDGRNDYFHILNMKYQKLLDFRVFNRWGQLVFRTDNSNSKGWDGTFNGVPQDIGIYNYVIEVARPDGKNKTYSGTVTLIR